MFTYICKSRNPSGFTLVELLITITIIGILAAIIVPSYNAQVQKTRRGDAKIALVKIAQELERCFSDFSAYNHASCNPTTTTQDRYYTLNIVRNANSFTITATIDGNTPQKNDTQCTSFTIDNTGLKTAANKAGDAVTDCW